jgi:molecular chaperone GrpE
MLTPLRPPEQNTKVLEALMPVLDSIEAGLSSGKAQLDYIEDAAAREILAGWLEGQRLLRERLLTLLERENVRPIPTLGEHFDPFRHVAVESIYDAARPIGTIVEERMRGYMLDKRVLRFAQVVVTRDRADISAESFSERQVYSED